MLKINNLVKCQGSKYALSCNREVTPNQAIRVVLNSKKNIYLDLCPDCFKIVYLRELKKMEICKTDLIRSGYYEQGARAVDVKSFIEKWTKNTAEQS